MIIHEVHASGADRSRPALTCLLAAIRPRRHAGGGPSRPAGLLSGSTPPGDRNAGGEGSAFSSQGDPIDTATPQGRFSIQVMGAVAEFERALIRERTKAGLRSVRAQGRVGGNPGLWARRPRGHPQAAADPRRELFPEAGGLGRGLAPLGAQVPSGQDLGRSGTLHHRPDRTGLVCRAAVARRRPLCPRRPAA